MFWLVSYVFTCSCSRLCSLHPYTTRKSQLEIWKLCEGSSFAEECDLISHAKGELYQLRTDVHYDSPEYR